MKPHHLLIQIVMAMAVLAAANAAVVELARDSTPRQLLHHSEQAAPATDLFLGDSTVAAGVDTAAFAAVLAGHRPLNLGLGASTPVEHYLVYLKQDRHRGATLYYGFLDMQLTDSPTGDWSTLVGNRAMCYYVDLNTALSFYASDCPARAFTLRMAS